MALERWQGQIAPAEAEATLALVSGSMEGSIFHWGEGRGSVPYRTTLCHDVVHTKTIPDNTIPYQTVPDRTRPYLEGARSDYQVKVWRSNLFEHLEGRRDSGVWRGVWRGVEGSGGVQECTRVRFSQTCLPADHPPVGL